MNVFFGVSINIISCLVLDSCLLHVLKRIPNMATMHVIIFLIF